MTVPVFDMEKWPLTWADDRIPTPSWRSYFIPTPLSKYTKSPGPYISSPSFVA